MNVCMGAYVYVCIFVYTYAGMYESIQALNLIPLFKDSNIKVW